MDNPGDESQKSQTNVDQQIATTSSSKQDTKWWEDYSAEEEATISTSHLSSLDDYLSGDGVIKKN